MKWHQSYYDLINIIHVIPFRKEMLVITLLSGQQRVKQEKQAELQIYSQRLRLLLQETATISEAHVTLQE